jgi:xylose isomerase
MRSYLILKEKAEQFREDEEIQALLAGIRGGDGQDPGAYSYDDVDTLKNRSFDRQALGRRAQPYEQLDQLVFDLLMGVR